MASRIGCIPKEWEVFYVITEKNVGVSEILHIVTNLNLILER